MLTYLFFQHFMVKNFKHAQQLRELRNESPGPWGASLCWAGFCSPWSCVSHSDAWRKTWEVVGPTRKGVWELGASPTSVLWSLGFYLPAPLCGDVCHFAARHLLSHWTTGEALLFPFLNVVFLFPESVLVCYKYMDFPGGSDSKESV